MYVRTIYFNMITTKIIFDRRKVADRKTQGAVEIRITENRKSYWIATGIRVLRQEWAAGQVVNRQDAPELNKRLAVVYQKVCSEVNRYMESGAAINIDELRRNVWQVEQSNSNEPTLIQWIEEQLPMLGISDGTRKHYGPLVDRLTEYGKMTRWQDVTVENIMLFDSWLRTLTKPISDARLKAGIKPERFSDGGIYNYHKCLKHLLSRADAFGLIERNPYERLNGKFKRGERENIEYLTEAEMQKFERMVLPAGSALDIAHDLFIFQAWTGLPYSDMQAFDIDDYKFDGQRWINTGERIKTGVPYVSSLLPPALRVLEKYGMKIPKLSNQDYNRQLKALGLMAGIKTRLHSHLARHTFATYMLRNGVKIENVSKMLGHTNITQTQRYAKVLAQSVHEDFDMIEKKMAAVTQQHTQQEMSNNKK